jgi:hypothetical protein
LNCKRPSVGVAAAIGEQSGQHLGQEIAGIAQPVEQRDVAEIGDPGLGREAAHAVQRQAARAIEQREMQQIRCAAHAAFAQQGLVRPGAGVEIHQ